MVISQEDPLLPNCTWPRIRGSRCICLLMILWIGGVVCPHLRRASRAQGPGPGAARWARRLVLAPSRAVGAPGRELLTVQRPASAPARFLPGWQSQDFRARGDKVQRRVLLSPLFERYLLIYHRPEQSPRPRPDTGCEETDPTSVGSPGKIICKGV